MNVINHRLNKLRRFSGRIRTLFPHILNGQIQNYSNLYYLQALASDFPENFLRDEVDVCFRFLFQMAQTKFSYKNLLTYWNGEMSDLLLIFRIQEYLEAPILLKSVFYFYLNNPEKACPMVAYIYDYAPPEIEFNEFCSKLIQKLRTSTFNSEYLDIYCMLGSLIDESLFYDLIYYYSVDFAHECETFISKLNQIPNFVPTFVLPVFFKSLMYNLNVSPPLIQNYFSEPGVFSDVVIDVLIETAKSSILKSNEKTCFFCSGTVFIYSGHKASNNWSKFIPRSTYVVLGNVLPCCGQAVHVGCMRKIPGMVRLQHDRLCTRLNNFK